MNCTWFFSLFCPLISQFCAEICRNYQLCWRGKFTDERSEIISLWDSNRRIFLPILSCCNGSRKSHASIVVQKAAGHRDVGRLRIHWEDFFLWPNESAGLPLGRNWWWFYACNLFSAERTAFEANWISIFISIFLRTSGQISVTWDLEPRPVCK